jgi:hypothetical protein
MRPIVLGVCTIHVKSLRIRRFPSEDTPSRSYESNLSIHLQVSNRQVTLDTVPLERLQDEILIVEKVKNHIFVY